MCCFLIDGWFIVCGCVVDLIEVYIDVFGNRYG